MGRFIKKVLLLILFVILAFGGISLFSHYIIGSQYKYNYQASAVDKVNRLKSISGPKIILVGDSNMAFGINSKMIEAAMGMPVVNLGLHGGMGNVFNEEIARSGIGEGDIVVVCHTSFSDDDTIEMPELAWITYDYNSEIFSVFRKKDYPQMLMAYPTYLKKNFILWVTKKGNLDSGDCYSRSAFNEYGDVVRRLEKDQMDVDVIFSETEISVPPINDVCINRLNELNKYCNEKGATLVVAGYPIAYGKYSRFTESEFEEFGKTLDEMLDCDVISDYADYFMKYEYFYDTRYHLTNEGANVRTEQLVKDLKRESPNN